MSLDVHRVHMTTEDYSIYLGSIRIRTNSGNGMYWGRGTVNIKILAGTKTTALIDLNCSTGTRILHEKADYSKTKQR